MQMEILFHGGDAESGNVFAVETKAEAGYKLESHRHEHSHLSVLVSGRAKITIDGVSEVAEGYKILSIPANSAHEVEAITDIVWLCLWSDDLAPKEQAYESLRLVEAQ